MKAKHVFTTLAIAFTMGLSVAAGLSMGKGVKEAKADATTTVYCKMTYSWWTDASAAIGVHYWGGSSSSTWPGDRMAEVSTDPGVWKANIPSDSTGFQFTRVNPTGEISDWGAKTSDLTFPGGGKNLYTITSSSAVWGNPGVTGEWSSYVEPAAASVYKMSVNGEAAITLEKNGSTTEYCLHDSQAFSANDVLTFTKDDVPQTLTVKPDGKVSTNNVQLVGGQIKVINATTGNIYWDVSGNTLWVTGYGDPTDGAAYLVGSFNSWLGTRVQGDTTDDENYTFSGVELAANAEIKAYNFNAAGGDDDAKRAWINPTDVIAKYPVEFPADDDGSNVIVTNSGTYDIKVNSSTGVYQVIPTTGLPTFKMVYNELVGEPITLTVDETDLPDGVLNQRSAILSHAALSRPVQFFKNDVEITSNISISGNASGICGDATNGFRIHNTHDGMKVYFKQMDDGSYEVWGDSYSVSGLYIDSMSMTFDGEYSGDYYEQYKSASTSFTEGQQIGASTAQGGYAFTVVAEAVAGNNLYTQDGKIYVHNDCEGILYAKRNYDGKFYLYLGGYADEYSLTIGGTEHLMSKVGENSYRLSGIALEAGQAISCKREGAAHSIAPQLVGNNNLTSDLKVLADVEAAKSDIYLDTENNKLWVGGLGLATAGGYHMLITNGDDVNFVVATVNPENASEYITPAHAFAAGDKIQIVNCDSDSALPIVFNPEGGINSYSENLEKFEVQAGVVTCKAAVTTKAYLQISGGADKIYFGLNDEDMQKAIEFVTQFKSAMATACSAEEKQDAVETAWAAKATYYKNTLTEKAQGYVYAGGYSSEAEIQEFAERYIAILQQHGGEWTLENFLVWDIPDSSTNVGMNILNIANNNTALVAIIASAIAVIGAAGLFFVIRRKKHN